jgi:hypothetical protein
MAKTNAPAPAPAKDLRTAEVKPAWDAFERGDMRGARAQARAIASGNSSEAVKQDARDLLSRTDLEPGVKITLLAMVAVLGAIVAILASRH